MAAQLVLAGREQDAFRLDPAAVGEGGLPAARFWLEPADGAALKHDRAICPCPRQERPLEPLARHAPRPERQAGMGLMAAIAHGQPVDGRTAEAGGRIAEQVVELGAGGRADELAANDSSRCDSPLDQRHGHSTRGEAAGGSGTGRPAADHQRPNITHQGVSARPPSETASANSAEPRELPGRPRPEAAASPRA